MKLDHIAVSAACLSDGVSYLETLLNVELAQGGTHAAMGTHNRLLSLGPDIYLEVIAIDPDAAPVSRARWFDLDQFKGSPRLTNWIVQTDQLDADLDALGPKAGSPIDLARGDLRWQMAVTDTGKLPFDDAHPALISWQGTAHPAALLPNKGCRLERLIIHHPEAEVLQEKLAPMMDFPNIDFHVAPVKKLTAHINTPTGLKVLE